MITSAIDPSPPRTLLHLNKSLATSFLRIPISAPVIGPGAKPISIYEIMHSPTAVIYFGQTTQLLRARQHLANANWRLATLVADHDPRSYTTVCASSIGDTGKANAMERTLISNARTSAFPAASILPWPSAEDAPRLVYFCRRLAIARSAASVCVVACKSDAFPLLC